MTKKMGQRGPKPKNPGLAVVKAITGSRKRKRGAAGGSAGQPAMPRWLDARAKREWNTLVAALAQVKRIAPEDGPALALLCTAYSRVQKASNGLKRKELTYTLPWGMEVSQPLIGVLESGSKQMLDLLKQFGMTPLARQSFGENASNNLTLKELLLNGSDD